MARVFKFYLAGFRVIGLSYHRTILYHFLKRFDEVFTTWIFTILMFNMKGRIFISSYIYNNIVLQRPQSNRFKNCYSKSSRLFMFYLRFSAFFAHLEQLLS